MPVGRPRSWVELGALALNETSVYTIRRNNAGELTRNPMSYIRNLERATNMRFDVEFHCQNFQTGSDSVELSITRIS